MFGEPARSLLLVDRSSRITPQFMGLLILGKIRSVGKQSLCWTVALDRSTPSGVTVYLATLLVCWAGIHSVGILV